MMDFQFLEQYGNSTCLIDEKEKISYVDLAKKSDQIINKLPKRTLLALYFYPSIDCIAVYLGALRNNHTTILIDPYLDQSLKNKLLEKFNIEHVFNGKDWEENYRFNKVKHKMNKDLRILLSTSGSTGSPKLIKISNRNLNANAKSIVEYMQLKPSDRAISSLPLHYSYGLSILNTHLAVGARFYLTSLPVTNKEFWTYFKKSQITGLAGVPATWRILRKLFFERMKLNSLRLITQAGGKLSNEEVNWLSKVGESQKYSVFIMYGQSEATARISYLRPEMISKKCGSIGQVIPGGQLYLKDENNKIIKKSNLEGELIYKGKNVMMGYASEIRDLNKNSYIDELYTGDLAYYDNDGFFWITGRKKRFIKIFGNRFGLDDIESFINEKGIEASVVGKDDQLIVVLNENKEIKSDYLISLLSNFYRIHHSAIDVIRLKDVPKNSAGKIEYSKLNTLCGID